MVADYGVNQTIRRRLNEFGLYGRITQKNPLLSIKNVKKHMTVCSDEYKFKVFGSDGKPYVRRPSNKQLDPKYTKKAVKHGGASIMVWGCFTASGIGPLVEIEGIMNGEMYRDILINNLSEEYVDNLPLAWIFQQEKYPKHTSKIVKLWLNLEAINVLHWPPQSPDLNPMENLWGILKQVVGQKNQQLFLIFV